MALFYIIQQLSSLLILLKLRKLYALVSLFLFVIIFLFKPDTFDLFMYPDMVISAARHEFLFEKVIDFISLFFNDARKVITVYQIFLLCVASLMLLFFQESKDKLLILAIILSSVAVMMSVHNNLRQGLASIIILISIFSYLAGYKKTAIILLISSQGFHRASIFFITIIFFASIIFSNLYKRFSSFNNLERMKMIYVLAFGISSILFIAIISSMSYLDYLTLGKTEFKNYVRDFEYGQFRTPVMIKNFLLLFLIIVTEFSLKFKSVNYRLDLFRFLRIFFLLTCLFLSFNSVYSEISNRILYMYYIIEMGLLCILVSEKFYNTTTIILVAYAFAFNVHNIIGGI
ncbi:EpsG family protein [Candidatus Pelagibacter ubique]|nr:EpsG family protein [Candidatus Pelagibacter ubique]